MPIPILVAIGATVIGALGAGSGVAIHKNNKFNQAQANWQDKRKKYQDKILEYQAKLTKKEERILELQKRLTEKTRKIEELSTSLIETDRMIENLEKRQRELDKYISKFIAIITFRFNIRKREIQQILNDLKNNKVKKNKLEIEAEDFKKSVLFLEGKIQDATKESEYYEKEIKDIEDKTNQLGA